MNFAPATVCWESICSSTGLEQTAEQWGTLALATRRARACRTARPGRQSCDFGDALLDFWDDFAADGQLDPRPQGKTPRRKPRWP